MTIYDIAREAGVSIATVSRVMNHKGGVSAETEARVRKVIGDHNFTPNSIARGLGTGCVQMVGIVCADIADQFYATAVSCIERELRQYGYETLLCCSCMDPKTKAHTIDLLLSKHVDAIILIGSVFGEVRDRSHIERAAAQVPVMVVNGEVDVPGTYCFCADEEEAVSRMVLCLQDAGRKRILYLYDANTPSGMKKRSGFKKAMLSCGAEPKRDGLLRISKDLAAAEGAMASLFSRGIAFDAVIASEDLLAVGAVNGLIRLGLRVPEDVAVIGINNLQLCSCCRPSLTSIDTRLQTLCTKAVEGLIALFAHRMVPHLTVVEASCAFRESFPDPASADQT